MTNSSALSVIAGMRSWMTRRQRVADWLAHLVGCALACAALAAAQTVTRVAEAGPTSRIPAVTADRVVADAVTGTGSVH